MDNFQFLVVPSDNLDETPSAGFETFGDASYFVAQCNKFQERYQTGVTWAIINKDKTIRYIQPELHLPWQQKEIENDES
tara:strand:- start:229 stop:465 length:237 start_codon:yes stop_codon:yes gene_type:complete